MKLINYLTLIIISLITKETVGSFCNHKKSGFYCNSDHTYNWCYGNPYPTEMMCPAGTSCRCGYSTFNPCGFHQQVLQDCYGSFQDNLPSPPSNDNNNNDNDNSNQEPPEDNNSNNDNNQNDNNNSNDNNDNEIEESESFEEINYCD